ncbi:Inositol phosphosphingolipids phospholipase C [Tolypocladium ophioglossoides CBS 100239]|uniref:Inositol phosphosphingolipids phospholipase C n=1 Tax=Tolypocladium ophioglossoides (strain CBS 100239) TaxID=1163406 RepID=A0A0L0N8L3_TOLOC|nr:Inositol phosphosphingolipids phospholipase C [Tolypocladium ophioglossoides CBS 100239]
MAASRDDANGHEQAPTELNLLTLNCWGLLHISTLRTPRLLEIGRQIAALSPPPHVVCLQECWVQDDYRAIRDAVRDVLPHAKFYHSGAFGGGLAIMSRWPIEESSMVPYPLNGRPTAFWRGDWYVGKGVACATLRIGPGRRDVVEVFNTHTHAPYESGPDDSYLCHRTAQSWEIAKLLRAASQRGRLVLALGDFNMFPCSLPHRIITARSPVRDVWRVLHPHSCIGPADHPDEMARGLPMPTAETAPPNRQNKLRAGKPCPVDPEAEDPNGKRLDYIFASNGDVSDGRGWVVESASVALTERHHSLHVSLSDHFAVYATLKLHTLSTSADVTAAAGEDTSTGFDAQLRASQDFDYDDAGAIPIADYDEILDMTHRYTARERSQRRRRFATFYAALAAWIGCLVAVWFSPRNFVSFLLMLLASLGLTAGVVDGLLALLFFSGEIRRLKEFKWEIQNARAAAVAATGKGGNAEARVAERASLQKHA